MRIHGSLNDKRPLQLESPDVTEFSRALRASLAIAFDGPLVLALATSKSVGLSEALLEAEGRFVTGRPNTSANRNWGE
jgi:hypothetical protein